MPVGPQETVLYPVGSRILCVALGALAAVLLLALIVWGRPDVLVRALAPIALVVGAALVLFWFPKVRVTPSEVDVVNPFRSYRVRWPAILEVGTRWSMTLYTASGRIEAWAAPAPGPLTQGGIPTRGPRASAAPVTDDRWRAQGAATIVRRQWEAYREGGMLGAVEGDGVERRWHPVRIAVLAVLLVLTVVVALLP